MIQRISSIESANPDKIGGKGSSLMTLSSEGFTVPNGIIVSTDFFTEVLKRNDEYEATLSILKQIDMSNFQESTQKLQKIIRSITIPNEIKDQITNSVSKLDVNAVAVRSSAVAEDSKNASFAGLHDSKLNVPTQSNQIMAAVRTCWESLFSDKAIMYRMQKDIEQKIGMALIIQEMIDSEVSGITHTEDPMAENKLLIEATYGYGDLIASGKVDPDQYRIEKNSLEIIDQSVGSKLKISRGADIGTVISQATKRQSQEPVLTSSCVNKISKKCLDIEKLFGGPQDIEWCLASSKIYFVQSRPIVGNNS